jgi:hypothetical protein
VADIDVPMDIVGEKADIKKIIKGGRAMFGVIQIPEVGLKKTLVGIYGAKTLTKMCFSVCHERSRSPGLKSSKGIS